MRLQTRDSLPRPLNAAIELQRGCLTCTEQELQVSTKNNVGDIYIVAYIDVIGGFPMRLRILAAATALLSASLAISADGSNNFPSNLSDFEGTGIQALTLNFLDAAGQLPRVRSREL